MGEAVRTICAGAAAALVLGVLAGRAMQPDLGGDGRPMGPQMFADWPGEGSTGPFDEGTTFAAAYRAGAGPVPDYVYGTDWKRSLEIPGETAAVTRASYEAPADTVADGGSDDVAADRASADNPRLARADDTTVAERAPDNPAREPAYDDAPAVQPEEPGAA